MNDFTKDDLYLLRRAVINLHKIDDKDSIESPLYKKIQDMISGYCEHEWENTCCQCSMDKIYCYKCEKNMDDLKERYSNE